MVPPILLYCDIFVDEKKDSRVDAREFYASFDFVLGKILLGFQPNFNEWSLGFIIDGSLTI